MTTKPAIDTFLDSDDEMTDIKHKIASSSKPIIGIIRTRLYIVHLGPFDLSTNEMGIRHFVHLNNQTVPCDVCIQIKDKKVFAFIAYKTLSESQQIINRFCDDKRLKICKKVSIDYNKHSKLLYDRSLFSTKTCFIQLFGLTHSKNLSNKDAQNWISKLLKWEYTKEAFEILSIRIIHNVRYPNLCGFAIIELANAQIAHNLVKHFQSKWTKNRLFEYFLDFVDPKCDFVQQKDENFDNVVSKTLIFDNLYWQTSKSQLIEFINNCIGNEYFLKILSCKVMASSNGYPLLRAIVTFESVKDAKIVQNVCNEMTLFDNMIFVRFHSENEKCEKQKIKTKNVSFADDENIDLSESEIDSDGENDILEMTDSENESDASEESVDSDDSDESEEEEEVNDGGFEKKFGLKEREMRELWKWCNPKKKYPNGFLTEKRHFGKYRKNWKELKAKDWLKEWRKKEKIAGKDKYWIRGGKLVNASTKWRERAKRKRLKN